MGWLARIPNRLWWPIIVVLLVAGAVAILPGMGWLVASTSPVPTIQVYSGTVATVSSDPKFGTHVTLEEPAGSSPSPDFFFESGDSTLPDVRVGDKVRIWVLNDTSGERFDIKLQTDRGAWIDSTFASDLVPPAPRLPYGLMGGAAVGLGAAFVIGALVGAYRRYAGLALAPRRERPSREIADPSAAAPQPAAVATGGDGSLPPSTQSRVAVRATNRAIGAVAFGVGLWLAALVVNAASCESYWLGLLMWLVTPVAFVVGAVYAGKAASVNAGPPGDNRGTAALGTLAIFLAVSSAIWVPVGLVTYVFSCLG